jgi:hypothetical protein
MVWAVGANPAKKWPGFKLVRAGGLEPPWAKPDGFSYQLRLSPPPAGRMCADRRLWSGLSLHPIPLPGFRCCPSSLYTFRRAGEHDGLARDCHVTGFPEFEQFCIAGFPASTQSGLKSVASTDSATPAQPRAPIERCGAGSSGAGTCVAEATIAAHFSTRAILAVDTLHPRFPKPPPHA